MKYDTQNKYDVPNQFYDYFRHSQVSAICLRLFIPFKNVNSSQYWNGTENRDIFLLHVDPKLMI